MSTDLCAASKRSSFPFASSPKTSDTPSNSVTPLASTLSLFSATDCICPTSNKASGPCFPFSNLDSLVVSSMPVIISSSSALKDFIILACIV